MDSALLFLITALAELFRHPIKIFYPGLSEAENTNVLIAYQTGVYSSRSAVRPNELITDLL